MKPRHWNHVTLFSLLMESRESLSKSANDDERSLDVLGRVTAVLTLTEIGWGALLHTLHLPLAGQFLSLNQIFWLARATCDRDWPPNRTPPAIHISLATATLKSLSPAGKKLTPMLAITAQGILFQLGVIVVRLRRLGVLFGGALAGTWAFLQPIMIYGLIFGRRLFIALTAIGEKLSHDLGISTEIWMTVFISCLFFKTLVSVAAAYLGSTLSHGAVERYRRSLMAAPLPLPVRNEKPISIAQNIKGTLKDICRPLFLLSLCVTGGFLYFSESSRSEMIWGLLRPLGVGFVIFFLLRWFPLSKWVSEGSSKRLTHESPSQESRWRDIHKTVRLALRKINKP